MLRLADGNGLDQDLISVAVRPPRIQPWRAQAELPTCGDHADVLAVPAAVPGPTTKIGVRGFGGALCVDVPIANNVQMRVATQPFVGVERVELEAASRMTPRPGRDSTAPRGVRGWPGRLPERRCGEARYARTAWRTSAETERSASSARRASSSQSGEGRTAEVFGIHALSAVPRPSNIECQRARRSTAPPPRSRLEHDGNPDLALHLANAVTKETPDGAY